MYVDALATYVSTYVYCYKELLVLNVPVLLSLHSLHTGLSLPLQVRPLFPPTMSCRTEARMDTGRDSSLSDSILGKRPAAVLCATDGPSSSREEGGDTPSGQPATKLVIKVARNAHFPCQHRALLNTGHKDKMVHFADSC